MAIRLGATEGSEEALARALVGGGVVSAVACLYLLVTDTPVAGTAVPETVVELLLIGLPALGLIYTGYWLRRGYFRPTQVWKVGTFAVSGVAVAAATTLVSLLFVPSPGLSRGTTFFLFVSTGTEGALLGVLLGVFSVRSVPGGGGGVPDRAGGGGERVDLLATVNSVLRHNIRNRLDVMSGRLQLLTDDLEGYDEDELDIIVAQQEAIVDLLEETKLASEMATAEADLERVDVVDVVREELRTLERTHGDVAVSLSAPGDAPALADSLLRAAVENVLENAVVHADRDAVAVDVAVERETDVVRIAVADDGPGIPEDLRESVFDPGVGSGTGMGLFLVDRILTRYGGEVRVADNSPRGTVVTLVVPAADGT
jgi:hypothetical protein